MSVASVMEAVGSPNPSPGNGEPARVLRVAQVITRLSAGAGGVALRGAVGLDTARYENTIFASDASDLIEDAEAAGLEVVRLRSIATGRGFYPGADTRAFSELVAELRRRRFDLVHTHSAKAGAIGRLAARRVGVRAVVHTFHGFPFHGFQPAPIRRGLVAIERWLGGMTDYFLAAGTMVAAEAVRLRIAPPDRIRAIAVPIADDVRPVSGTARRHARRALGLPAEASVVGTAARLDDQKAPVDLVRAIAILDRAELYAVWAGDGPLRDATERAVARHGLDGRFLLLGERTDVPSLLPAFDVFAMASLFEGLPCALVEAMAAGVPVVATAVNSVPEIVVPGKTGLLARPRDPASLATAIAHLLEHPNEARRMAAAAREHVGDRFRTEAHAIDLELAYSGALRHATVRAGVGGL